MQEKIMEFQKFLERELGTEIDNIMSSGSLSSSDICTMKDAFKLMKLIGEYEESGYSNRRGRSRTTGRYVSRDSYGSYDGSYDMSRRSYDRGSYGRSGHTQIISELEKLYGKAQDERERQMIDEWIQRAESQ